MKHRIADAVALFATSMLAAGFATEAGAKECKPVHAQIVSSPTSAGCASPIGLCTAGTIDGNQGLSGTTSLTADSAASGPVTAPQSAATISYSGVLTITTSKGTLTLRDTGVFVNPAAGPPSGGYFSSFDLVLGGTGKYNGATGDLRIGGSTIDGQFVTSVISGQLCLPRNDD